MDEIENTNPAEEKPKKIYDRHACPRGQGASEKRYLNKRRELVELMYFNWGWSVEKIREQILLNKDILNLKPSLERKPFVLEVIYSDINYLKESVFNNMVKDPESTVGGIMETLAVNIMVGYNKRKDNLWTIYARCQKASGGHKPDDRAAISALEAIRREEGEVIDNLMNLGKITKQEPVPAPVEVNVYADGSGPLSKLSEEELRGLKEFIKRNPDRVSPEEPE